MSKIRNLRFCCLCFCLLFNFESLAQNPEGQVRACIDQFFEGLNNKNPEKIKNSIIENCHIGSIVATKDSSNKFSANEIDRFIAFLEANKELNFEEVLHDYTILFDGGMAMAWTPYTFYLNNEISHCGVNLFTLIKKKEGYRILSIVDTRRKKDCQ